MIDAGAHNRPGGALSVHAAIVALRWHVAHDLAIVANSPLSWRSFVLVTTATIAGLTATIAGSIATIADQPR